MIYSLGHTKQPSPCIFLLGMSILIKILIKNLNTSIDNDSHDQVANAGGDTMVQISTYVSY